MEEETIEVKKELIEELFNIAKIPVPENISEPDILNCIIQLKSANNNTNISEDDLAGDVSKNSNNVLIIDDIGIVTYQLKIMLTKIGYNVQTAKDIFNALNIFVKSNFDYVIMDLFVSTEQEGYTLLNEVKKIITKHNLCTKIIVITASNKTENKIKCINGGADFFVKKDVGWQDKIIEVVGEPNYNLL